MTTKRKPRAPHLEEYQGRSNKGCENRAQLAEQTGVDEDTVARWMTGKEPIPDPVIAWLSEHLGGSVSWLMNWEDAPRSEIPEQWRRPIALDAESRLETILPNSCEKLVEWIEWGLSAAQDLDSESSLDVPRLQRLRAAVLEYLAEPLEEIA